MGMAASGRSTGRRSLGIMERNGELRAKVVPNATAKVLHAELDANVAQGANVMTTGATPVSGRSFTRHTVNYPIGEYVRYYFITRTALRTRRACSSRRSTASATG